MADAEKGLKLVKEAYRIENPDDNVRYYGSVAGRYDSDFAEGLGWSYPREIARIYRAHARPEDVPVADIGCGTGWIAQELGLAPGQIDGMDISPEMLTIARGKGLYGRLFEIDLTSDLGPISNGYGAVVSAGTFTHGHLGPNVLRALTAIARPGGLFVIGVNKAHHQTQGFAATLGSMLQDGLISNLGAEEIRMYDKSGHSLSDDRALVLTYRRL